MAEGMAGKVEAGALVVVDGVTIATVVVVELAVVDETLGTFLKHRNWGHEKEL